MYTLYAVIIFSMFISQGKSCYTSAAHTAAATGTNVNVKFWLITVLKKYFFGILKIIIVINSSNFLKI